MTKGDHIYTLNYNIKSLEQKQNEEQENEYIVKASSDYKVSKDDEEVNYYRMINTVDDILKIIKELETDEKQTLYLVHQSDNLINLYF
jgi:isopentenyldiphosphate isomerase